mmetsp:Transcript_2319/g.6134  ORF Transcript_2319/g.6134 Transcript_2319/m.6134 type:complete len:239 (+) Transcript_2319:1131-1847(+)
MLCRCRLSERRSSFSCALYLCLAYSSEDMLPTDAIVSACSGPSVRSRPSIAARQCSSASSSLFCECSRHASAAMEESVSAWSAPSVRTRPSIAARQASSASSNSPRACITAARLVSEVNVWGASLPRSATLASYASRSSFSAASRSPASHRSRASSSSRCPVLMEHLRCLPSACDSAGSQRCRASGSVADGGAAATENSLAAERARSMLSLVACLGVVGESGEIPPGEEDPQPMLICT